jgi:hypothetical protein
MPSSASSEPGLIEAAGPTAADPRLTHAAPTPHLRRFGFRRSIRPCRESGVFLGQMLSPAGRAGNLAGVGAPAHELLKLASTIVAGIFKYRHNKKDGCMSAYIKNIRTCLSDAATRGRFVTVCQSAANSQTYDEMKRCRTTLEGLPPEERHLEGQI